MHIGRSAAYLDLAPPPPAPNWSFGRERRLVPTALLVALLVLMAMAPSAVGSSRAKLAVSGSGGPGTRLAVRGTGLPVHALVRLRWDGSSNGMPLARTTYFGILSTKLTVPAAAKPGRHLLTAVRGSIVLARATVTVPASTPATGPTPTPTPSPTLPATAKLLFGLGPEIDSALAAPITSAAPVQMLTSWFNGTSDLSWMSGWSKDLIPQAYAAGDSLHLIVYASSSVIASTSTQYGTATGRAYPLSAQFLSDMTALAKIWAGATGGPPLYVTLFTEFQTYAPTPTWAGNVAYWSALKDAYRSAVAIFHANAPNARVSLGWGGWEARMQTPMFADFADVMGSSDFQSFQAMQGDTNVADIEAMTAKLGTYGPVMLAHYKPDNGSQTAFDADTSALFTDAEMAKLTSAGLFAFSYMDTRNMSASPDTYTRITAAIQRYGR